MRDIRKEMGSKYETRGQGNSGPIASTRQRRIVSITGGEHTRVAAVIEFLNAVVKFLK
jgi:hypothetical protein